jgi:hypothetical protein
MNNLGLKWRDLPADHPLKYIAVLIKGKRRVRSGLIHGIYSSTPMKKKLPWTSRSISARCHGRKQAIQILFV